MNIKELEKKLIELGIPKEAYQFEGGFPNEMFCINNNGKYWEIYYSEHGNKTSEKKFMNEKEACEYFLQWLKKIFNK